MTVLEASSHLYTWFSENESFNMKDDFIKIIAITESPNRDRAAFLGALKEFEVGDLVQLVEGKRTTAMETDEVYWVLKKPFYSYSQSISISSELCLTISEIVNGFCNKIGDNTEKCNPMNVQEADIQNLILIANILLSEKKDIDSNGELD